MKKVWTDMPPKLIADLTRTPVEDLYSAAVAWCERNNLAHQIEVGLEEGGTKMVHSGAVVTFEAMGRWLKGDKKLITLTPDALELLITWDWRWGELPPCDGPRPESMVFSFEPWCMVFVEVVAPAEVRYVIWYSTDGGKQWGSSSPDTKDPPLTSLSILDTNIGNFRQLIAQIQEEGMAANIEIDVKTIMKACVNAYAAIHADPRVLYAGKRRAPRRRMKSGSVSGVKKYQLTIDGARTITKRWETLKNAGSTDITRKGSSKGLHTVEPHYWHVWVNSPRPDEKVIAIREKQRTVKNQVVTYKQYRVRRWRKGDGENGLITRGKGALKTKSRRVVTGVHDL